MALRRVARYGDGWFPSFVTPEEFKAGMERLVAYGAQRGRSIDPGEAGVLVLTYASHNRERASAVAQLVYANFQFPPEAMAARCAIGTPEECVEKVRAYVAAGCTKYVLFPIAPADELIGQIELFAKQIIPRFS